MMRRRLWTRESTIHILLPARSEDSYPIMAREPQNTTAENDVERVAAEVETAETGKDEVKSFAGTSEAFCVRRYLVGLTYLYIFHAWLVRRPRHE